MQRFCRGRGECTKSRIHSLKVRPTQLQKLNMKNVSMTNRDRRATDDNRHITRLGATENQIPLGREELKNVITERPQGQ
jgi:hypothetical protein